MEYPKTDFEKLGDAIQDLKISLWDVVRSRGFLIYVGVIQGLILLAIILGGCDRHYARVQAETCEIMTHLDAQNAFLNQTWNARWEYQREIFRVAYRYQTDMQDVPENVLAAMQPCD